MHHRASTLQASRAIRLMAEHSLTAYLSPSAVLRFEQGPVPKTKRPVTLRHFSWEPQS